MKTTMATILIPANQYSASPNDFTDSRLTAVMTTSRTSAIAHTGRAGIQLLMICPPTTASKPTTITQKYQYSQPVENPAQRPIAIPA